MISWPYTKLMNSNNMVDQGAAIILAAAEKATHLQIPTERWVFPHAGTDSHDTYVVGERRELSKSPAIRIGGRRVLELADAGVDDIDLVDVYSCFPSAVQVAAAELGLPLGDADRPLTVTGGLTFAGGPWNNYVTHSIATMAERLAGNPGQRGLITANGGYLTKHSFGVYGSEPPQHEFRWEDVQSAVDAEPTRKAEVEWSGVGAVEAWTTPFDRNGSAEKAFVAVRTPEDSRTLAVITDAAEAEATVREDIAGAKVHGPSPTAPPTSSKRSQRLFRVGELGRVNRRPRPNQRLDVVEHVPDVDVHPGQHPVVPVEPERDELTPVHVAAEYDARVFGCVADVLHAEVVLIGEEVGQFGVFGRLAQHACGRRLRAA